MNSGPRWKVDSLVYKKGYGPIDVKIVDPLNVPNEEFMLAFDTILRIGVHQTKIMKAGWHMWKVGEEADEDSWITSDRKISVYDGGKRQSGL